MMPVFIALPGASDITALRTAKLNGRFEDYRESGAPPDFNFPHATPFNVLSLD